MNAKNIRNMELVQVDIDEFMPYTDQILEAVKKIGSKKLIIGLLVCDAEGF